MRIFMWRPLSDVVKKSGHTRDVRVPFYMKYVEAILQGNDGFEVVFIDSWIADLNHKDIVKKAVDWKPNVVIVEATTPDKEIVLQFSSELERKVGSYIIAIGQDPSSEPEKYVFEGSPVQAVLRGEPEDVVLDLVKALKDKKNIDEMKEVYSLGNMEASINIVDDLNSLPTLKMTKEVLRKYQIFYPVSVYKKIVWGHILTSRGCPYGCTFCSQVIRESYGSKLRFRDVRLIMQDVKELQAKGMNMLYIADDDFTCSREHVVNFCKGIISLGISIRWTAHARVDEVDLDLLKLMKQAGCVQLRFGVESSSEEVLKAINKTAFANQWEKQAIQVFQNARNCNIDTVAMFLIGSPEETEDVVEENIRLAKTLNPDLLQICFFTAYPGSIHYESILEEDVRREVRKAYHYSDNEISFCEMSNDKMNELYGSFYKSFYLRWKYVVSHVLKYSLFYLCNWNVFAELLNFKKILWDRAACSNK